MDYRPTASWETLALRARLLRVVREFFDARGYLEVETPLLSHDVVVDAWLEPFCVRAVDSPANELYLQTSPEFGMKRLLCSGATAIYQITRAFRRGEQGRHHNPEFTMIEWYRLDDTHHEQMGFVEELVCAVMQAAHRGGPLPNADEHDGSLSHRPWSIRPFERLTYDDAFERYAGSRVLELPTPQLIELAGRHGIQAPGSLAEDDRDGWLNLLLAQTVEPRLGRGGYQFVFDYPATQAALARIRRPENAPPVADRFELYAEGVELCNGYHELTDPAELRRRIEVQSALRQRAGLPALPQASRLLEAMEIGLPPCSGVALGFDRLVMLAAGKKSLADVMAFPFDRA